MEDLNNIEPMHKDCAEKRKQEFQKQPTPVYKMGDYVKAAIETGEDFKEWMWFEIKSVDWVKGEFTARLDNIPLADTEVKLGDIFTIKFEDVCQYLESNQ